MSLRSFRMAFIVVLALAATLFSSAALAQRGSRGPLALATVSTPVAPVVGAQPVRRWYGWQIIISDAVGGVLQTAGIFSSLASPPLGAGLFVTGQTVSFFGGPIVHWAHGHVGRGFASMFGLRVGLPFLGGLLAIGPAVASNNSAAATNWIYAGIGLGSLVGWIIDVAVLAFDEVQPGFARRSPGDRSLEARTMRPSWTMAPSLYRNADGATMVGVTGWF